MADNLVPGCEWGKERMAIQETKMAAVEKAIIEIKNNDLAHIADRLEKTHERLEKTQDRVTAVLCVSLVLALAAGAQVALQFLSI